jgi:hypothetical protein
LPLILQTLTGVDEDELRSRLGHAAMAGILPLMPFLVDAERQQRQQQHRNASDGPNFSQLFGVDLLLDKHGAAWLLEVNSFPSLSLNSTVPFLGEGKCCRCMDDYRPHVHVQSPVDHSVKLAIVLGTVQLLLGCCPENSNGHRFGIDNHDGDDRGGHEEGGSTTALHHDTGEIPLEGDTAFTPLVPDETEALVLEGMYSLAHVFGKCCKGGAATADPFRLRKLFAALGKDVHAIDLKLRQLAQDSGGLSFLPVINLLLGQLRSNRGDNMSVDTLAAALRQASEQM